MKTIFARHAVRPSQELQRILAIPRRKQEELNSARSIALCRLMTSRLSKNIENCQCKNLGLKCIKTLKPIQALALYEAHLNSGLFGSIGVGSGKTALGILTPLVIPDCRTCVLLIPPTLKDQLRREYETLEQHFFVPSIVMDGFNRIVPGSPVIRVVPYSMFSRAQSTDYLINLQPDLIIADECHRLKNKQAASTSRVVRYFAKFPDTRFCCWSGTITNKSIKDYAHLLAFVLRERSPLPLNFGVLEEWSLAIDPSDNPNEAGSLQAFCEKGETVQQGYYKRLVETHGVVATKAGSIGASLQILEQHIKETPKEVLQKIKDLKQTWTRPDGEELVSALDVARVSSELATGFFYRWIFPKNEPVKLIDEWFETRQLWNKELREKLKHKTEHLDSPLLCENAASRFASGYKGPLPVWDSEYYRQWQEIKSKVYHETEAVWVSDFLIHEVIKWMNKHKGLVWYVHDAFGSKLCTQIGHVKHGGGIHADQKIREEKGDKSIILSVSAHGTGRDGLQYLFDTQLLTSNPTSGQVWEQLLGRLHRQGQPSDEITTYVFRHTEDSKEALDNALRQSEYIQATTGNEQKLLIASKDF